MPHVPCMAWLPGDGSFSHKEYRNYLSNVDTFNRIISEMTTNSGKCANVVSFENEGEIHTRLRQSQNFWKSFREEKKEEMMHLTDYH